MSAVSQIKDAWDLKTMGALTSPEFDKLKARILGNAGCDHNLSPAAPSSSSMEDGFAKLVNSFSCLIDSVSNTLPTQLHGKRMHSSEPEDQVTNPDGFIPATLTSSVTSAEKPRKKK